LRFLGARGKPSQRERLRCLLSLLAFVGDIVGEWKVEKQIVKIAGFFLLSKLFTLVRNKAI
jgi:uncharacterized membrane protein (UPF0136 family)